MVTAPDLDVAGLDNRRLRIIAQRWHMLDRHLSPWFSPDTPWFAALRNLERERQIPLILSVLEQAITTKQQYRGSSTSQQSENWQHEVLVPLARDLRLFGDSARALISICLNCGWFDSPHKKL